MSKTIWHSGPPPSLGWWPASFKKDLNMLRWWDGECWSIYAWRGATLERVLLAPKIKIYNSVDVYWTARPKSWPARSFT